MRIWRCIYSCLLFFVLITGCTVSEHSKSDSENTQSKELTSNNTESELQAITALTGDELVKPYVRSKNSGSAKELVGDMLIVNVMAVSYTHLDVYKRQLMNRPNDIPLFR